MRANNKITCRFHSLTSHRAAVILDETMELLATKYTPEVAKAKLVSFIDESKV